MTLSETLQHASIITSGEYELEAQAKRGLHLELFRTYWPALRSEFDGSGAFVVFVDSIQGTAG